MMVKRRRRLKQTTTLAQRLTQEASRLRDRAKAVSPGPEQAQLWSKVRQAEAALRIDEWLGSGERYAPAGVVPLMGKSRKKGLSNRSSHESP
jgi:hypothetical protein